MVGLTAACIANTALAIIFVVIRPPSSYSARERFRLTPACSDASRSPFLPAGANLKIDGGFAA